MKAIKDSDFSTDANHSRATQPDMVLGSSQVWIIKKKKVFLFERNFY